MIKAFAKVALTASLMTPLMASAFCMQPVYGNNQQLNQMAQSVYEQCVQQQQMNQQQQQYQQQQQMYQQQQLQQQQQQQQQMYQQPRFLPQLPRY